MRQHRAVAAFELELHEPRQQRADLVDDAALVGFGPVRRHLEIHAVRVGLEQRHAARGKLAAQQIERLAPAPGHLVGRVHIGETRQRAARRQVAVGGIDDDLQGRRRGLGCEPLGRARGRTSSLGFRGEPPLDERIDQAQQSAERIA